MAGCVGGFGCICLKQVAFNGSYEALQKKNSGVRVCVCVKSLEGLQRLQCHERGGLL